MPTQQGMCLHFLVCYRWCLCQMSQWSETLSLKFLKACVGKRWVKRSLSSTAATCSEDGFCGWGRCTFMIIMMIKMIVTISTWNLRLLCSLWGRWCTAYLKICGFQAKIVVVRTFILQCFATAGLLYWYMCGFTMYITWIQYTSTMGTHGSFIFRGYNPYIGLRNLHFSWFWGPGYIVSLMYLN